MSTNYTYKVDRNDKTSEVKVAVTVASERYAEAMEEAYTQLAPSVKIKGFRPGKAPRAQVVAKLGSDLLSEALRIMVPEIAAEIVNSESFNPINQLEYDFSGDSDGDQIQFSFEFINYPEVKVGDLSKIKVTKETAEVTETEIDDVIRRLFGDNHHHDHEHAEGEEHDHEHEHVHIDPSAITDEQVAELKLGELKTIEALRTEIRTRLQESKSQSMDGKYQDAVIQAAIDKSTIQVPPKFIELRLDEEMADFERRIAEFGLDKNTFLEAQGKNEETMREEKREQITNAIKAELILNQIAKDNSIIPTSEDIDAEIAKLDPESRAKFSGSVGRRRVLSVLIQNRGLQKLMQLAEQK